MSNWDDDDYDATAALEARVAASNVNIASVSSNRETAAQRKNREDKEAKRLAAQKLAEKLFDLPGDHAPKRTREPDTHDSEDDLGKLLGPSFDGLVFNASMGKDELSSLAEKIGRQFYTRSSHRQYTTFAMQLMRALCGQMSKGDLELVRNDIDAAIEKKGSKVNGGATSEDLGEVPSNGPSQAEGDKRPNAGKNTESSI